MPNRARDYERSFQVSVWMDVAVLVRPRDLLVAQLDVFQMVVFFELGVLDVVIFGFTATTFTFSSLVLKYSFLAASSILRTTWISIDFNVWPLVTALL